MNSDAHQLLSRSLSWALALAVSGYALLELVLGAPALAWSVGPLLLLAVPAALAGHRASAASGPQSTRLSLTFVLAAFALLPPPGGLLVAISAALVGRGAGVAGAFRRGPASFAALGVAAAIAQFFAMSLGWPSDLGWQATLMRLAFLYVIVQGFALALTLALDLGVRDTLLPPEGPSWRTVLLEALNIPLALVLVELFSGRAWLHGSVLSLLILLALVGLGRLDRALGQLRETNEALSARVTELATLHAIGREILASMKPGRVFTVLERECRKIFDVDGCFIALTERDTARLYSVYSRQRGGRPDRVERWLEQGLASWVAQEKRSVKIDDLGHDATHASSCGEMLDRKTRSAMAVPLIVEEQVIGVLWIESRTARAYDEHQLAVLTTIAQQAAVAIENVRHYQMATMDSLTGFFLRDYFFRRLDEEHNRAQRYGGAFALLMLDLDGFKEINDRNGHLAGDEFLREISDSIRAELRSADLACRYGGDEFCLLLPETDLVGAQTIAERIRHAVAAKIVALNGVALRTTVSIGLVAAPAHGAGDANGLMRKADEALYRAKQNGRDRVVPFAA